MERFLDTFLQDAICLERQRNSLQDSRIDAIERRFDHTVKWFHGQFHAFQERLNQLEDENAHLRMLNAQQTNVISELQWRVDPYSKDGDAICNSVDDIWQHDSL